MKNLLIDLKYGLHVIIHPFDGFWILKHEKRGGYPAIAVVLGLFIAAMVSLQKGVGFIVNPNRGDAVNIVLAAAFVLVIFFLWCICNWGITTLMNGEGAFRDIAVTTAYALFPVLLLWLPALLVSRVVTIEEASMYTAIIGVSVIWAAALLFAGILTIHQFTITRTFATIIIAILGMAIVAVLAFVFISLVQQFINFIIMIYREISLRR